MLFKNIFLELKKEGAVNTRLWCIKANSAACSFYKKHGGKRIENVRTPQEYSAMPHIIYAWEFLRIKFRGLHIIAPTGNQRGIYLNLSLNPRLNILLEARLAGCCLNVRKLSKKSYVVISTD